MALSTLLFGPGNRLISILVFIFYATLLSTNGIYSYGAGALVLFSLWKIRDFRNIDLEKKEAYILIWMLVFSGISIAVTVWHGSYMRSFEVPIKFLFGALLVLCMIKFPPKPATFWLGLCVGSVTGLAVASWKMWQAGDFKAFGFTGAIQFGNLALSMAVLLLVALCWLLTHQKLNRSFWFAILVIGAVCGLLGSYYSGTRGGWVAIPLFMVFFLLAYARRSNLLACSVVLLALVTGMGLLASQSPLVAERIALVHQELAEYKENGTSSSSSLGARFAIWEASWELLKERPILGFGEVEYRKALQLRTEVGLVGSVPASLANTHNAFLEFWVLYGLLALLALLAMMLSAAWYFLSYIRHEDSVLRSYALSGTCLVGGYVIYGQTQIMLSRNNTLLFFLCTLAVLIGLMRQRQSGKTNE
ncbi:O-antigen ligase family protein [Alcaligenes faecalis subsp. phenolicus]|uniref:O-antigen ligase family protein n=1 Tax=Alcaligenes nematophilus TaxID=2994643 RepID=UPI002AA4887B|nr:O-antigen ligase family protein [Alcaligenes phenolicus]